MTFLEGLHRVILGPIELLFDVIFSLSMQVTDSPVLAIVALSLAINCLVLPLYKKADELREWLDTIPNLFCVGRNGQHRYNNIDHSMCTSFETVRNILSGAAGKDNIWNVNTEKEYHEEK